MLPPNSNKQQYFMKERMEKLRNIIIPYSLNILEKGSNNRCSYYNKQPKYMKI